MPSDILPPDAETLDHKASGAAAGHRRQHFIPPFAYGVLAPSQCAGTVRYRRSEILAWIEGGCLPIDRKEGAPMNSDEGDALKQDALDTLESSRKTVLLTGRCVFCCGCCAAARQRPTMFGTRWPCPMASTRGCWRRARRAARLGIIRPTVPCAVDPAGTPCELVARLGTCQPASGDRMAEIAPRPGGGAG